jgi:integrase
VRFEHRTWNKDRRVLADFLAVTGDRDLAGVSVFAIEQWKTTRAESVSRSTVNRELNVIRGLFSRAVLWGRITVSPTTGVRRFAISDSRRRVLNSDEIRLVLREAPASLALIFRTTLECMARLSEVLGLRREHIGDSWIEICRKGGAVDRIPIASELRQRLLEHCHASGWVFGRQDHGEGVPPTQAAISVAVARLMRRLGCVGISHHSMRHTCATLMLDAGVSPRAVQQLGGWTTLRMVERYGHVHDAELQRAVRTTHERIRQILEQPKN